MPEGVVGGDEFAGAAKIYGNPGVAPLLAPQPLLAVRNCPCNIDIKRYSEICKRMSM